MRMTTIAKKRDRRRLQQTSRRERFAPPKSARRRSASTLKHVSASLVRQPRSKSHAATRPASLQEGRVEDVVEETTSLDRATSSHLREQQHLVEGSCSNRPTHRSLVRCTYKEKTRAIVGQAVDLERRACKTSLFVSLEGQQAGVDAVSRPGAVTAPWLGLHEKRQCCAVDTFSHMTARQDRIMHCLM